MKSNNFSGAWHEKTLAILKKTGYIDARSNTVKKGVEGRPTLNKMVNDAVFYFLTKNGDSNNVDNALRKNLILHELAILNEKKLEVETKSKFYAEQLDKLCRIEE
jgi:hypothetical protein